MTNDNEERHGVGGNNPPGPPPNETPFDEKMRRKNELWEGMDRFAKQYPVLDTQELCDKASDFKRQFTTLKNEIDAAFETEKEPWLNGGRAVDNKWRTLKSVMPLAITAIQKRLTDGLNHLTQLREKERKEAEEKLRVEREAAEKLAASAAELQRKADAGELIGSDVAVMAEQERAMEAAANVKTAEKDVRGLQGKAKAGSGTVDGVKRRSGLRDFHSAVIVQPLAALAFFARDARIQEALQTVANERVRSIMTALKEGEKPEMPPGIELKTELKVV